MSGHEKERLCAYLDGELNPVERAEVEAHLAACPACAALLADLTAVDAAGTSLPAEAPEGYFDTFPSRVVRRLGATPGAPVRVHRLPTWTWAAAAALLLAVAAPLTLRRSAPGPVPTAPAPATPRPASGDVDLRRERDTLSSRDTTPAPGGHRAAELAFPPAASQPAPDTQAVPESRLAAGKPSRNEALGAAAQAPLPPPAAPAEEKASSRAKLEDAAADASEREEPALVAREAFAAPQSARAPERMAQADAAAPMASSARHDEAAAGALAVPGAAGAFRQLEAWRPRTAEQWRRLRDAWNGFATAHPDDPRTDEARVRAIEAGREAWLAEGAGDDEAALQRDARAYLAREDALQKARVERLLSPPRRP